MRLTLGKKMPKLLKRVSVKRGQAPGTAHYVGVERTEPVRITVYDYDRDNLREVQMSDPKDCFEYRSRDSMTWINITGVHEPGIVEVIGQHYGLHSLAIEDILNTSVRPKLEVGDGYVLMVAKMLYPSGHNGTIVSEQVSVVFGDNYVISFQEKEGDVFQSLRERLRATPRVRFLGSDYLAYTLIDAIVDGYFIVLEQVSERIEDVEQKLIVRSTDDDLEVIHKLKRELVEMRRRIYPLREVVSAFQRLDPPRMSAFTPPYLHDLYEHVVQVRDTVDSFREMATGLLELYLTSVSNRMNEVMKMLTIIATIFIPLSFLAGVYGMNFDASAGQWNMPELRSPYGYIAFWTVTLIIGGGLFFYFRRKRWL